MRCERGALLLRVLWRGLLPLFAAVVVLLFAFHAARPGPEPIALALTAQFEEQNPGDEPRWPDNTYLRHSLMARVAPEFVDVPWFIDAIAQYHEGFVDWESQLVPGLVAMRFPRGNAVEAAVHMSQTVYFSKVHLSRRGSFAYGNRRSPCPPTNNPDPLFGQQVHLRNTGQAWPGFPCVACNTQPVSGHDIRAAEAWCRATDCSGKIIAVVDTGVAYKHPDLRDNMWVNPGETPGNYVDDDNNGIIDDVHGAMVRGFDCGIDNCPPPTCPVWNWPMGDPRESSVGSWNHGTQVAAIIGAIGDNDVHATGICWSAKIMAVGVAPQYGMDVDCNGYTCYGGDYQIGHVQALEYAITMGADIINISWGFNVEPLGLKDMLDAAEQAGIIVVIVAHNDGVDLDQVAYENQGDPYGGRFVPAIFKRVFGYGNIIVTTALALDGTVPAFASYGVQTVDVAGYSPCVRTIDPDQADPSFCWCEGWFGGTSATAPQVSAAAALIWTANPSWTCDQVITAILSNARYEAALDGLIATEGVLDIDAALP